MSEEIYWIDDKEEALPPGAIKENLENVCGAKIRTFIAKHRTLDEVVALLDENHNVKMIVLDYWLANLPRDPDRGAVKTEYGSAWAGTLRAAHPELAIVGVTSETISHIPDSQKSQFLQLLSREDIFNEIHDANLSALIEGFPRIYQLWIAARKVPSDGAKIPEKVSVPLPSILGLLSPPQETSDYLVSAFPEFSKQEWDQETPHEFSLWVIDVLQGRPGFLVDPIELATLLGLSISGLEQVESYFEDARYTGIFASDDRKRWWTEGIRPRFEKALGREAEGPMRMHRLELLEVVGMAADSKNLSLAHGVTDNTIIPDTVCFADEERIMADRVQALRSHTAIDPIESPPSGFEARRIWKGQD